MTAKSYVTLMHASNKFYTIILTIHRKLLKIIKIFMINDRKFHRTGSELPHLHLCICNIGWKKNMNCALHVWHPINHVMCTYMCYLYVHAAKAIRIITFSLTVLISGIAALNTPQSLLQVRFSC